LFYFEIPPKTPRLAAGIKAEVYDKSVSPPLYKVGDETHFIQHFLSSILSKAVDLLYLTNLKSSIKLRQQEGIRFLKI